MLRVSMMPSNAACDLLALVDEHERMLVNTLLWTTICVAAALFAGPMLA